MTDASNSNLLSTLYKSMIINDIPRITVVLWEKKSNESFCTLELHCSDFIGMKMKRFKQSFTNSCNKQVNKENVSHIITEE